MDILHQLGIDWKLLLAQLVNFSILLYVLHRFLYKPLLGVLERRSATIEKSLADAKALEERVKETSAEQKKILASAKHEAAAILEKADALAEQKRQVALKKAKEEVAGVVQEAREKILIEKDQMLLEAKKQFEDLVLRATEAVLLRDMKGDIPQELIKKVAQKAK